MKRNLRKFGTGEGECLYCLGVVITLSCVSELSKFFTFFCSIMIGRFDKTGLGAVDSFVFFKTLGINPFRGKYDYALEL